MGCGKWLLRAGLVVVAAIVIQTLLFEPDITRYILANTTPEKVIDADWDFIIVGGGAAGLNVGSRLARSDELLVEYGRKPNILILEAGSYPPDIPPVFTLPPHYQFLGGPMVYGFSIYTKGMDYIYNLWEKMGCVGWAWKDIAPYFDTVESQNAFSPSMKSPLTYHLESGAIIASEYVPGTYSTFEREVYGSGGSTTLDMDMDAQEAEGRAVAESTMKELNLIDKNALFKMNTKDGEEGGATDKTERWLEFYLHPHSKPKPPNSLRSTMTLRNHGRRFTPIHAYMKPHASQIADNLQILLDSAVTKLIIEGHRAVGIEFVHKGQTYKVYTQQEIILSAGVYNSPKLLMLSGIGPKEHLNELGIPVILDLPGVGYKLQEHVAVPVASSAAPGTSLHASENDWIENKKFSLFAEGTLTTNAIETVINLISSPDEPITDIVLFGAPKYILSESLSRPTTDGVSMMPVLMRPKSFGKVSLRSKDPMDPVLVEHRFFSAETDMAKMIKAVNISRDILFAATEMSRGEIGEEVFPGRHILSDAEIEQYIRDNAMSMYDGTGTCRMGMAGHNHFAVVDNKLRVIGMDNLRVIDASIIPEIPNGLTYGTVLMVAERAADMIVDHEDTARKSRKLTQPEIDDMRKQAAEEIGEIIDNPMIFN